MKKKYIYIPACIQALYMRYTIKLYINLEVIVVFTRAAFNPAHNDSCGPFPKKGMAPMT
jgi:hypothetical protein